MMQFRYKITKDILWGGYTLHIQYQVITCAKWKKFKRVDLFRVCTNLNGNWDIVEPSLNDQLIEIDYCMKSHGSMRAVVTTYILNKLKDEKKWMNKCFDTKNIKQVIDGLADNTWSDVIAISENEISEE